MPPEVAELAALQSWTAEREVALESAASGADASEALQCEAFDLVVCDATQIAGVELLRDARARGVNVPFVLLTAGSADDLAHRVRTLGRGFCVPARSLTEHGFAEAASRALASPAVARPAAPSAPELAPAMLWRTGPDGAFEQFSQAWLRFTGRLPEQELGSGWIAGLHPEDVDRWLESFGTALGSGGAFEIDLRVRDAGGDYRWLRFAGQPRSGAQQEFTGFLGASFDVSDLVQARVNLEREVQRVTTASSDLEQFASAAAHDLDEPLRTLENALRELDEPSADREGEPLDVVRASARRMRALIRNLLECALIGSSESRKEPVDLSTPLDWALENLEAHIRATGARVTRDTLPLVECDPVQLARAFQNLIANALRFRSNEAPLVHVSAYEDGGEVIIVVQDNGIGLDPEHHECIFEPFKRVYSGAVDAPQTDVETGSGLGLALCKRVAERHGGRIWVESEPGKGATFYLTLRS